MSKLPNGWKQIKFGDYFEVLSGHGFKKSEYTESGIPLLRIENVGYGQIQWSSIAFLPTNYADEYSNLVLQEDDILLALNRPITNNRLKIAKLRATDVPSILYQRVGKIVLLNDLVINNFSFYLLQYYLYFFVKKNAIGSDQPYISLRELYDFEIPLPPLPEQRKIAEILSTWDEAIRLVQALLSALKARKQGLMQLLIPSEINPHSGWSFARLSDFIVQDKDYVNEVESKLYPRISVKWWANGAVVAGYDHGDDVKMKRHQLAKSGQIIVSEIWAKHGSIGIIPEDGDGALITSHFYLFNLLDTAKHYESYIHELVNSNYFMIQADRMSQGSTGYASIRAKDFLNFKVPVPSDGQEQRIADLLHTCDELIKKYAVYSHHLREQKKGLMQRLLTGEVRVKVED